MIFLAFTAFVLRVDIIYKIHLLWWSYWK